MRYGHTAIPCVQCQGTAVHPRYEHPCGACNGTGGSTCPWDQPRRGSTIGLTGETEAEARANAPTALTVEHLSRTTQPGRFHALVSWANPDYRPSEEQF